MSKLWDLVKVGDKIQEITASGQEYIVIEKLIDSTDEVIFRVTWKGHIEDHTHTSDYSFSDSELENKYIKIISSKITDVSQLQRLIYDV